MHFSIRRGRRINLPALMAQKRWPDNAVISGRRTASYAAGFGAIPASSRPFALTLGAYQGSPPAQLDPALLVIPIVETEPSVTRALLIERVLQDGFALRDVIRLPEILLSWRVLIHFLLPVWR
jgi:hypothetical protein